MINQHVLSYSCSHGQYFLKHGAWDQYICTSFVIARMKSNFYSLVTIVSYSASLSTRLFSQEADGATCWLAFLSGKCRVAVK